MSSKFQILEIKYEMIIVGGEQENIEDDDKVSTLEFFRPTLRFCSNRASKATLDPYRLTRAGFQSAVRLTTILSTLRSVISFTNYFSGSRYFKMTV